jgi:uncharacterized protein YbjT (DUF2867 family)
MAIQVIITGVTGMVGEGVLLTCLQHPEVEKVLMVNRKHYEHSHPKLSELIVPDFLKLDGYDAQLSGYNACFFCAGISSVGMSEEKYTVITYDTTLHFASKLASLNPGMVFTYVSGSHTDSTENGKLMWARVKGRTENALMRLPFKKAFNFRPGVMTGVKEQKNVKFLYKIIAGMLAPFMSSKIISLHELGMAMINAVTKDYPAQVLEIKDIKTLARM